MQPGCNVWIRSPKTHPSTRQENRRAKEFRSKHVPRRGGVTPPLFCPWPDFQQHPIFHSTRNGTRLTTYSRRGIAHSPPMRSPSFSRRRPDPSSYSLLRVADRFYDEAATGTSRFVCGGLQRLSCLIATFRRSAPTRWSPGVRSTPSRHKHRRRSDARSHSELFGLLPQNECGSPSKNFSVRLRRRRRSAPFGHV